MAIVRDGVYIYANPAYLKLFGHRDFSDIEGKPVLGMVRRRARNRLTKYFDGSVDTSDNSPKPPPVRFTLRRRDGSPLRVNATFQSCIFDDEPCIEIRLHTEQKLVPGKPSPAIPWRYYLAWLFSLSSAYCHRSLLPGLNIDNDPRVYFPDDEPAVILDEKLRTQFPNDQVYILLFEGLALFSDDVLNAYHQLARTLEKNPLVEKVYGLTTQDHIAGSEDGFLVEPVINTRELAKTTASRTKTKSHRRSLCEKCPGFP